MTGLNPRFTFDSFVVGGGNKLAATAARSVAESPGTYNPLFIYSPTGLGKTHLLMSIGQMATRVSPSIAVEYVMLEEFVELYHAAVAAGQVEAFRHRFSEVDVVLLDDVQFLTHRREMQSELLRLTTLFQEAGKQIVMTSDRPPSEIENLDERLISRFDGGLVVDIGAPEYETRRAILERRARERGAEIDAAVIDAVAKIDTHNVRELLGFLNRLVAVQAVGDAKITPESALAILTGDVVEAQSGALTPQAAEPRSAPSSEEEQLPADEFSEFLSGVTERVAQQVEEWSSPIEKAIRRWSSQGYRTDRLSEILAGGDRAEAEKALSDFERDVSRLRDLEAEVSSVDSEQLDAELFRDPDRIREAEEVARRVLDSSVIPLPAPSPGWSLDSFMQSESNSVALVAAHDTLKSTAAKYNPLVFVGSSGVGKSHLMHGLANAMIARDGAGLACLSAHEFTEELVEAMERDEIGRWRRRYRRATALFLDDVQLAAGKEATQQELFNLFNHFFESGRQLVFTLNAMPRDVEGLDDRLVSRLEGGLIAQIEAPDRSLRAQIVSKELSDRVGDVDRELADYLADRPAESIRAVRSHVQRVVTAAEGENTLPTAAFARRVLEAPAPAAQPGPRRVRTSGVVASPSGGLRSYEKVVWSWPDVAERIIEDVH